MVFTPFRNFLARSLLLSAMVVCPAKAAHSERDFIDIFIEPSASGGVTGSSFYPAHNPGSQEDYDCMDFFPAPGPSYQRLMLYTIPYGVRISGDSRGEASMSHFNIEGVGIDPDNVGINSPSNDILFEIIAGLATNRNDYLYDLKVFGTNDSANPYFTEGGSMRDTITNNNSRIYGSFALTGITNEQKFLEMPFIPVKDSASFFLDSATNGSVSLDDVVGNTNTVRGINGKLWTEEGNTLNLIANGNLGYKPTHYSWNGQTNELTGATNETLKFSLENVVGWSDGVSNRLQIAFSPLVTQKGTPYLWLYDHGLAPSNDLDVMAGNYQAWQHYQLDTDPTNSETFFNPRFYADMKTVGGEEIVWDHGILLNNTSTNVRYRLEMKTNLLDSIWKTNVYKELDGTGGDIKISHTNFPSGFYRVFGKRK